MRETASQGGNIEALRKAPEWFVRKVSESRVDLYGPEYALPFKGRPNNDRRFSKRQKAINKIQEIKAGHKETAQETVKRIAALKKRAKR